MSNQDWDGASSTSQSDVWDMRERIDVELEELENRRVLLRSRRNMLSAISRLPDELLAMVFVQLSYSWTGNLGTIPWIIITHICRYWRSVALNCPELWSHSIPTDVGLAREVLSRSKNASLNLYMADSGRLRTKRQENIDAGLRFLTDPSRIQSLSIHADDDAYSTLESFTKDGCSLNTAQSLEFCNNGCHKIAIRHSPAYRNFISSKLTPRLCFLRFNNCRPDWDVHLPDSLIELTVTQILPDARFSLDQVLNLLGALPNLRTLYLQDALPNWPWDLTGCPSSTHSVLPLLQLQSLHLGGVPTECAILLRHLELSPSMRLSLRCSCDIENPDYGIWRVLPEFTRYWTEAYCGSPVTQLSVLFQAQGLTFAGSTAHDIFSMPPRLVLELHFPKTYSSSLIQKFIAVCTTLPLRAVEQLALQNPPRLAARSRVAVACGRWRDLLWGMERITALQVCRLDVRGLCEALAMENVVRVHEGQYVLPKLERLRIKEAEIRPSLNEVTSVFDPVRNLVKARRSDRVPIRRLVLDKCPGIDSSHIHQLGGIVPDMRWDGIHIPLEVDEMFPPPPDLGADGRCCVCTAQASYEASFSADLGEHDVAFFTDP